MPQVDVSEILTDPDLADLARVTRQWEAIGQDGVSRINTEVFEGVVMVATSQTPADLIRRDDATMMQLQISVVTQFRLRGPSQGFQADQITIDGSTYVVKQVMPFSRFGAGFVEAIAEALPPTPAPPAEAPNIPTYSL